MTTGDLLDVLLARGDVSDALTWLERAVEERTPALVFLNVHAIWDSLRSDPRFEAVTKRIGLPPEDRLKRGTLRTVGRPSGCPAPPGQVLRHLLQRGADFLNRRGIATARTSPTGASRRRSRRSRRSGICD